MKKLLVILAALALCLLSCRQQTDYTTMDSDIANQFRVLDTLSSMIQSNEDLFAGYTKKKADSIMTAWTTLANLCCEEKPEQAYEFLHAGKNQGDILIYLRNTTAQYYFNNEVLLPLALASVPEQDAIAEYLSNLELNFAMTRLVVVASQDSEKYIPPHYMDLIADLGFTYDAAGESEKAINMAEMIREASVETGNPEIYSMLQSTAYLVQIYLNHGDVEGAAAEIANAKAYIAGHPAERDNIGADTCESLLASIQELIDTYTPAE